MPMAKGFGFALSDAGRDADKHLLSKCFSSGRCNVFDLEARLSETFTECLSFGAKFRAYPTPTAAENICT